MRLPISTTGVPERGASGFDRLVAHGGARYQRELHLPRILPVGPQEISDTSESGRRSILRRLARALRAERNRGRAGHWTYDLNRHIALAQAYAAERAMLAKTYKA